MKKYTYLSILILCTAGLSACGSSGGSGTTSTTSTKGLSLPTEISAVPTKASVISSKVGLKSQHKTLRAADAPETDYSKALTTTFVDEETLEQFDMVEQVLGALSQTHYSDPSNIGKGPYKSMVAWQEEEDGIETKKLEPWVVQSDIIQEDGQEVTRARVWIEEIDDDGVELVKGEFKVYQSATKSSDGAYSDYGVWTLNVKFGDAGTDYFVASAEKGPNGEGIIKLHDRFPEGPGFIHEVRAILNKTQTSGFGKVSYPDWESCQSENCNPGPVSAKYAYNDTHLAVQKDGQSVPTFKDRNSVTEMTHHYGMYDSTTGADVFKSKSFGFPVFYSDTNGNRRYAYYGAWQGRHELWGGGESGVPAGTTVTRDDHGEGATPQTYTVSSPFKGTLTKRIPVAASLSDVQNIPVETWVNENLMLVYDNSVASGQWAKCIDPSWGSNLTCGSGSAAYNDFGPITYDANNPRQSISINRWDNSLSQNFNYSYLPAGHPSASSGTGFYVTTESNGELTFGAPYSPTTGDELWVNIGGSIYIEYNGSNWVQKTLKTFDERNWTPVFDSDVVDPVYTLPVDREIYINAKGANYIVESIGSTTTVKIELQTVSNPLNTTIFVPAGTEFKEEWADWTDTSQSIYEFITDSSSAKYMKLVYKAVGSNDTGLLNAAGATISAGDVANRNFWGLKARVGSTESPTQYNWDYPRGGENWGTMTYLKDGETFIILDDPIMLKPSTFTNNAGESKTLSLQYDGWMHGLPDLFEELRKKEFVMDAAISNKIINIPSGTSVTDAQDPSKTYLIKPLEVSQFLNPVTDPGTLDIATADSVDLSTVPDYVEHGMGTMPKVNTVRYSEGILIN